MLRFTAKANYLRRRAHRRAVKNALRTERRKADGMRYPRDAALTMRNIDRRALMLDPVEAALALRLDELRPKTRGECPDTSEQPCPWYGCRHHLGLEVSSSGTIKYREIGPGEESCSLDVADDGEQVYERMGQLLGGLTRERSRQLIAAALARATMAVAIGEKLRTSDRAIIMAELDRVFSARGSRRKVAQGLYTIRKNRIVR